MEKWGMLSHPQNKDSLPWTLGSSLEGNGREESQPATHPRRSSLRMRGSSLPRHSLRKRESRKNNTAFITLDAPPK